MKHTIKTHTKAETTRSQMPPNGDIIHQSRYVIALDPADGGSLQFVPSSTLGPDDPFCNSADLAKALKKHKPKTDSERVDFLEAGRYDVTLDGAGLAWEIYDNELKDYILESADLGTWREAVDALMDLHEDA